MYIYKLYEVKIVNKIPMWSWITDIYADNIVDAEFQAANHQRQGTEYILTINKK